MAVPQDTRAFEIETPSTNGSNGNGHTPATRKPKAPKPKHLKRRWLGMKDEYSDATGVTYRIDDDTELFWRCDGVDIYLSTRVDGQWITSVIDRPSMKVWGQRTKQHPSRQFNRLANRWLQEQGRA